MKNLTFIKKKSILFLLIVSLLLFVSGCRETEIWFDLIKFDDITYIAANSYLTDEELDKVELGEVYKTVKHKVPRNEFIFTYKVKNGDAASYPRGTKVYSVVGYKPTFLLAINSIRGLMLFKADFRKPVKAIGADIYDIENKVEYITLNSDINCEIIKARIDNKADVERITNIILNSPIDGEIKTTSDEKYYIKFFLKDGTSMIQTYLINNGILRGNIKIPNEMKDIIESYLEN